MLIPILISVASLLVPAEPPVSPPDVTSARSLLKALRVQETVAPAAAPRGYGIEARVCQGDPLGSVEDGDVKVLGSVSGGTVPNSGGWFRLVQSRVLDIDDVQVAVGYSMRTDFGPAPDGKIRLRLTLAHTGVLEDGPQETVARTSYRRHDRLVKAGETVRLRWGKSADRDTWLELTVREEK